jgi:hypothetical protein
MNPVIELLQALRITPPNDSSLNYETREGKTFSIIDSQCRFTCRYCVWNSLWNEKKPVGVALEKAYTISTLQQKCGADKCDYKIPFLTWMDQRDIK